MTVTVTATDAAANATVKSFTVTVRDTTPPSLSVPTNLVVEATSAAGAVVNYPAAIASDLVSAVTLSYSQASGTVFPLGVMTVTVTATDAAGNATVKSFTVTVRDTTAPVGTIVINGGATTTGSSTLTVALSFTDAVGLAQMRFSLDGGLTWTSWETYSTTKTVTAPTVNGTQLVIAQVSDRAGNVGSARDDIVITSAPTVITISLTGVACGCGSFGFSYDVASSARIVSTMATLDGAPISNRSLIDTFYLAAGAHTIVVTATDAAGKTTTTSQVFEVHMTIECLIAAVKRAVREGLVSSEQEQPLLAKLEAAKASRDRGNVTPEINQLEAFIHDLAAQRGKKIAPSFSDRATGWAADLINRIKSGAPIGSCGCVAGDDDHHVSRDDSHATVKDDDKKPSDDKKQSEGQSTKQTDRERLTR